MWTLEDLHDLNPPEGGQDVSFLSHLLAIGATTSDLLSEVADRLELMHGPFVAAIAQLPFDLGLNVTELVAPGDTPDSRVQLLMRPCNVGVNMFGRPVAESENVPDGAPQSTRVTQVVGFVRLADKRERIRQAYLHRLSQRRSLDQPLGEHKIESWMHLPQAQLSDPIRRRPPLTGRDIQREVAARARHHLRFAVNAALRALSVASLEEIAPVDFLYGYHLMITPGRIACANAPVPVVAGLLPQSSLRSLRSDIGAGAFDLVGAQLRLEDPVVRQLQAMNRLLCSGEHSLALVGCVTAVEWFLDARFPDLARTTKGGLRRSASVSSFLKSDHSHFLSTADREFLERVIKARNEIAHGAPPVRARYNAADNGHAAFVREALFAALSLYRAVNALTNASSSSYVDARGATD